MKHIRAKQVVILVLILAMAGFTTGCGTKYTAGQNMASQSLVADAGLEALEASVVGYYQAVEDRDQKVFIYKNIFPLIDKASAALLVYQKAAQRALAQEKAGGKVTDVSYLLKEALKLVNEAKQAWRDFQARKGA